MINTYQYLPEKGEHNFSRSVLPYKDGMVLWTDIESPDDAEIDLLRTHFNFHPLAVEDCIKMQQRSKFDDYGQYFFVVMHSVADLNFKTGLNVTELAIFVGHGYIVTFHHESINPVSVVGDKIKQTPELMGRGVDYILYLIVDSVIDEYFPAMDHIDDKFSVIENKLFGDYRGYNLKDLFNLKRTLVHMRKILTPQREMVNALIRYEGVYIKDENRVFYFDVYDHIMRMFDFLDTYRELISGTQELYLTIVSNKMNEIMKTLTIIATIILPLTLITGVYGMNFRYMPELNWRYGYLWSMLLMTLTTGGFIYYFRKKNWF